MEDERVKDTTWNFMTFFYDQVTFLSIFKKYE